ncbi:MAG: ABC-2 family transporter protein [Spirochaetales bacterium]|nr:ABC-2 family transporter protein [Spirochaetales bacterium]
MINQKNGDTSAEETARVSGSRPPKRMGFFTRRVRMLGAVAFVTYKEWAAYRSHMLLSLFVGPVFFLVQRFIWTAVYQGQDGIAGFSLSEMIRYYGVTTIIYYLTMDFADWNLQMHIRTGSFLTFMLRPLHHRFFAFSQKVGHRVLGFLVEFVPIWIIFAVVFDMVLLPVHAGWALLSLFLGFLMMFYLNYSVGIIAFWMVRTDGIRSLIAFFRDVLAGVFLPLTFFPSPVQKLLFFLPFQFTTYVPARVFLGSYELAGMKLEIPVIIAIQAAAVCIMWCIGQGLWLLGVKRYTGVGV